MKITSAFSLLLIVILLWAEAGFSHHGLGGYDIATPIPVTGTVTEFNVGLKPHGRIRLLVMTEDGETQEWEVFSNSNALELYFWGWTGEDGELNHGKILTAEGYPAKDGSLKLLCTRISDSAGVTIGPSNPDTGDRRQYSVRPNSFCLY